VFDEFWRQEEGETEGLCPEGKNAGGEYGEWSLCHRSFLMAIIVMEKEN